MPPLTPSAKYFQKSVGVGLVLTGLAYGVYNYNKIYRKGMSGVCIGVDYDLDVEHKL